MTVSKLLLYRTQFLIWKWKDQLEKQWVFENSSFGRLQVCMCTLNHSSCVWFPMIPWAVARHAPLSMGILQARILEWVPMPSARGSSQPRNRTQSLTSPALAGGVFFNIYIYFFFFYFTILYWFCHTSKMNLAWVYTCSQSWNPSPLPPHTISLGHPSAPAPRSLKGCRFTFC